MTQHDSGLVAFAAAHSSSQPVRIGSIRRAVQDEEQSVTLADALRKKIFVATSILANPALLLRARQTRDRLGGVSHALLKHRFLLAPFKPFCTHRWTPAQRLDRMINHLETVSRIGGILRPREEEVRLLSSLPMFEDDYSVRVDEPSWTNKDGLAALSLWRGTDRLFKITFLLQTIDNELVCLVGGIQGRNGPDMLDLYRDMTKQMHGLRPRDFMVELHRLFCVALGVKHVLAVSEDGHYFRDPYWGRSAVQVRQINLDDIWQERGGVLNADGWFELPLEAPRKDIEQIPAKKRSLYRKRYELLDMIAPEMIGAVRQAIGGQADVAQLAAVDVQAKSRMPQIALAS